MNPITILEYAHKTILTAVEGLSDAEWDAPNVCGTWSTKQIIGHLNGWEHYFEEFIAPFAGSPISTPYIDDYKTLDEHGFNDKHGTHESRSPSDLLADFNATYARIIALARHIAAEKWREQGTLPWSKEDSLDDFAVYGQYGHKYEHAAQIVVFRDQLKQKA
jgi:uncharacterized damage-inducible protein DinB